MPREADTKDCPWCAEAIKAKARLCRFCGSDLESGKREPADEQHDLPRPSKPKPPRAVYYLSDVAALIGIHRVTAYKWLREGRIPRPDYESSRGINPRSSTPAGGSTRKRWAKSRFDAWLAAGMPSAAQWTRMQAAQRRLRGGR